MEGWNIFKHAVMMLWNYRISALKIAAIPWVLLQVLTYLLERYLPETIVHYELISMAAFVSLFSLLPVWIAVSWHRFILLGDTQPARVRSIQQFTIVTKYTFVLFLIAAPSLLILFAVFFYLNNSANFSDPSVSVFGAILFILGLFYYAILYRFGVSLVALAIGRPIGLSSTWRASRGKAFALAQLIILIIGCQVVFLAPYFLYPESTTVEVIGIFTDLALLLIGVSVLTTMYGTWVEGREL